jgi:hypothetical protein
MYALGHKGFYKFEALSSTLAPKWEASSWSVTILTVLLGAATTNLHDNSTTYTPVTPNRKHGLHYPECSVLRQEENRWVIPLEGRRATGSAGGNFGRGGNARHDMLGLSNKRKWKIWMSNEMLTFSLNSHRCRPLQGTKRQLEYDRKHLKLTRSSIGRKGSC